MMKMAKAGGQKYMGVLDLKAPLPPETEPYIELETEWTASGVVNLRICIEVLSYVLYVH